MTENTALTAPAAANGNSATATATAAPATGNPPGGGGGGATAAAAPTAAAPAAATPAAPAAAAAAAATPAAPAAAAAAAPAPAAGAPPTMLEYKKEQAQLRNHLQRRAELEKKLQGIEETIAVKESTYLDSTPNGNIIIGFDHYMKGTGGAAAQRRKTGMAEQHRVFSRSSVSYRPNANNDAATPGSIGSTPASHAPTPISASFRDGPGASNHATPTSSTAPKGGNKKRKHEDDSEAEVAAGNTKKRSNLGAARK